MATASAADSTAAASKFPKSRPTRRRLPRAERRSLAISGTTPLTYCAPKDRTRIMERTYFTTGPLYRREPSVRVYKSELFTYPQERESVTTSLEETRSASQRAA